MNKKILTGSIIVVLLLAVIIIVVKLTSKDKSFEQYITQSNDTQIDTEYSTTQTKSLKDTLEYNSTVLEEYGITIEELSKIQYNYVESENKYTYIIYKDSRFLSIIVWIDSNEVEIIE